MYRAEKKCGGKPYRTILQKDSNARMSVDDLFSEQYPFIVKIMATRNQREKFHCVGIILTEKWVLAPGHCIKVIQSLLEEAYVADIFEDFQNKIEYSLIHFMYDITKYDYDVGLLRVKESFSSDRVYIRLVDDTYRYELNSTVTMISLHNEYLVPKLKKKTMNIFESKRCGEVLPETMFCVGSDELTCAVATESVVLSDDFLVGVASRNKNCKKVYIKVSYIHTSPELGRHLIATRDLNSDDLILCEYPLVFGPRPHVVEEGPVPCIGCFRLIIAEQSPRCEGCGWPVCHAACEGLRDPLNHGLECLILGLRPEGVINKFHDFYRQDTLLVLRCLLLQKKGQKKWEQLMELESHLEARGPKTDIHKNVEERTVDYLTKNFLERLKDLERKAERDLLSETSSAIMHKIAGIIDVNALEINQDVELSAIYPVTSLLEHSCLSNTYHIFDNALENYKITVRASVPIGKGDHISTTYTHALWGTQARREHLMETKYFSCQCLRCKDPTELGTYLSALRCIGIDGQSCGGNQLPLDPCNDATEWACDKCNVKLSNDEVAFLVNKIGSEVDYVQLSNPTVKEMRDLLDKILNFLHPHHYHVYSIKHSLVQLYGYQQGYLPNQISDELLLKKSEMCRELIAVTKTIDPGNARLPLYSGVLLHELFLANAFYVKRKWHVEDKEQMVLLIEEGTKALSDAKLILRNEPSSAAQKLRSLLVSSNKELRNWMERYKEDVEKIKKKLK
ncbi:hypothetical protein FQA39_LY08966 [Lamprigera yunnana]|nr:hypothetical protein FQA39_LY08966 [Lamprigera yunnana]